MVNFIFVGLFIIGLAYGMFTGRVDVVTKALVSSPKDAMIIFFNITALLIFWSGILEICKDGGLLNVITKGLKKILKPLFKDLPKDNKALDYIAINLAANAIGCGSAATPFGLKAMKELDELNGHSKTASKDMITLLVINTSGICLIPSTIISLREAYQSQNSSIVLPFIIITTTLTTIFAIVLNGVFSKRAN